tara:strand:+ start:5346 stop:6152 length:807 start_codon:yes stop_codon:yes gene_type:complete
VKKLYVKGFDDVDDPVRTEEQIYRQLSKTSDKDNIGYSYVVMPIADMINKSGVKNTQNIINDVCEAHNKEKLIFVCQHIQVCNLYFHDNLVFTPHATMFDSYIPIPHYSCNYDLEYSKPWEEREYDFSFMGDYNTHATRNKVYNLLKGKPKTFFVDTKNWHFYSDKKTQAINKKNYIELLGNTKYSLCPRGTGPSTIRIWESMAMGSSPIIFSDYLKMPLELYLNNKLWFKVSEKCDSINVDHERYNNDQYWDLFSNEQLYKSIIKNI